MSRIAIKSLAQLKREVAIPNRVLILDRHDIFHDTLRRSPADVANMSRPRKIIDHSTNGFSYENDIRKIHLTYPKAKNIIFNGTNSFTILNDGKDQKITYRIEDTNDTFLPSHLSENHPFIGESQLKAEKLQAEKIRAEQEKRRLDIEKRIHETRAIPAPPSDPRYAKYRQDLHTAVSAALAKKLFYTDEIKSFVEAYLENRTNGTEPDFANVSRQQDHVITSEDIMERHCETLEFRKKFSLTHPRGSWTVIRVENKRFSSIVSTIIATGCHEEPIYSEQSNVVYNNETIISRLHGHEIYKMNNIVEEEIKKEKIKEILKTKNLTIGKEIGPIQIGLDRFSKAQIAEINHEAGTIKITASKRGSRRRYEGTISLIKLEDKL